MSEVTCAICLEPVNAEAARSPPCGHAFHGKCLLFHTFADDRCPCCRAETPARFEDFSVEELAFAMREITRVHRRTLRELKIAQEQRQIATSRAIEDSVDIFEFASLLPTLMHR